jgi:hypothetical protein
MKSKVNTQLICATVFAALVAAAVANYDKFLPLKWQTYTAPDNSFTVEFPGKPTVEAAQAPVEGGGTKPVTMISVNPSASTAYMVSYVDDDNVASKSADDVLANARDGSLSKTQGTVLQQNRLTIQGYPAMDLQASARGDSRFDARMVVVGKRLYMLMIVATVEQDRTPKNIQRMFASFKINHP